MLYKSILRCKALTAWKSRPTTFSFCLPSLLFWSYLRLRQVSQRSELLGTNGAGFYRLELALPLTQPASSPTTTAIFLVNLGQLIGFFLHPFWKRTFGDKWQRFLPAGCTSCYPTNSVKQVRWSVFESGMPSRRVWGTAIASGVQGRRPVSGLGLSPQKLTHFCNWQVKFRS